MSQLQVLSAAVGEASALPELEASPDFRKATRSMTLGYAALHGALQALGPRAVAEDIELGLALGTCFGELGTTKEFLTSLAERGMARPLLFQNSLYNSIAGFLAIQLKITGPAFTVSHELRSGLDALELAATLCQAGVCDVCLVATVDARVPDLDRLFEPGAEGVVEGAGCVAVALPETVTRLGLSALATVELPGGTGEDETGWSVTNTGDRLQRPMAHCPLFRFASALARGETSGQAPLDVSNPQGSALRWRRP